VSIRWRDDGQGSTHARAVVSLISLAMMEMKAIPTQTGGVAHFAGNDDKPFAKSTYMCAMMPMLWPAPTPKCWFEDVNTLAILPHSSYTRRNSNR